MRWHLTIPIGATDRKSHAIPSSLAFSDSFGTHTAALASLVLVPGFANRDFAVPSSN